jgi:hypothetical protein
MKPRSFRIGSPKANNNPVAPTQKQQRTTNPKIMNNQGLVFDGGDVRGGSAPVVSILDG